MRISDEQLSAFIHAIEPFIKPHHHLELRLFGSRLDDNLKGGDIDLLITCDANNVCNHLDENKASILAKLYMALGEENIDLLIIHKAKIHSDPFIQSAYETSKIIHRWPNDQR